MNDQVKIFGILNATPDSFSDGGKYDSVERALGQAEKLFGNGADFVDVGGESTRPGARELEPDEEWGRLAGFFESISSPHSLSSPHSCESGNLDPRLHGDEAKKEVENGALHISSFSLDTRKPEVAEKYLKLGGTIINDVSGFQDPKMGELVAMHGAWAIVNHFPGGTIAEVHEQKICSINQIQDELLTKKRKLIKQGIDPKKIILDPGIGFGKTMELNESLLKFPTLVPDEKIMIGHSKKRFLGEDRLEKTRNIMAAQTAISAGAWALRVHEPDWI